MVNEKIELIIRAYGAERRFLIPILQDIQAECHYLSQETLRYVAERLRLPLIDVYSLATFYNCFSLKPRGKHFIKVCLGTACHLKGGARVVEAIKRELGVHEGEMTPDGQFTFETVRCVGACALAPLVLIDEQYRPKMSQRKITQVIQRLQRTEAHETRGRPAQAVEHIQPAA
jgi:NADH-quinone oxidoreductase subunit E